MSADHPGLHSKASERPHIITISNYLCALTKPWSEEKMIIMDDANAS